MKKIFFVTLMFSVINVTYAEECTEEKIKELKQIAEQITVDTEFNEKVVYLDENKESYITIQGLKEGFYMSSDNSEYAYSYGDSVNGTIVDTIKSDAKKLYVYNTICPDQALREIKLSLKTYNPYSEYKECKGISGDELDVCGKFYDKNLTESEFLRRVKEYKEKNIIEKIVTEENNYTIYLIIGGAILVIGLIVILINKRKRNILD